MYNCLATSAGLFWYILPLEKEIDMKFDAVQNE